MGRAVEFFGPALELIKTGSPYLAGAMLASGAWIYHMREMQRHYAAEAALRQERYDELLSRNGKNEDKCEKVTDRLYATERELAAVIRDARAALEKAGIE